MIRGRCPICSRSYEIAALADLPTYPFCSSRCRLIDLGRWIDEAYVVPESDATGPADPDPVGEDEIEGD
jgi:endogenous inhibitor of DNA gyrase (YacG/DUF329 family)